MKTSTISQNKIKDIAERILAVASLLIIWQIVAMAVGSKILLASPIEVAARLFSIIGTKEFISAVGFSTSQIIGGFLLGAIIATALAVLAGKFRLIEVFLSPLMVTVKSVPVASFIVIALVWLSSSRLPMFISFLMVLPIVYTNMLKGIKNLDHKMNEFAALFKISTAKKWKFIILPQLKPFIMSASGISAGLAWKAGIAAEVIGRPDGSVGGEIYLAKVYLNTADLFAWTVVVVAISVLFEKLFAMLINKTIRG